MIYVILIIFIVMCSLYIKITKDKRFISYIDVAWFGVSGYLLGLLIFGISIERYEEKYYELLLSISLLSFLSTTLVAAIIVPLTRNIKPAEEIDISNTLQNVLIAAAVLFNIGFVFLVLTKLLPLVLASFIDGQGTILLSLRKAIASGEYGYFAPGLVRQIRDILCPALIAYVISRKEIKNKNIKLMLLMFSTLIAMLISGQRSPILVLILVIFISYLTVSKNLSKKILIFIGFITIVMIQMLNFMLGRSNEISILTLFSPLIGMIERVFVVVPKENYQVMQYVNQIPVEIFQLWVDDLKIILPMNSGQSFSNILHAKIGGSTQGNSVLGLPLDNYLNAGFYGVVILPIFYLMFLYIFEFYLKKINVTIINKLSMVIMINIPFTYSPYYFLLNGALWIVISLPLLLLARKVRTEKLRNK